jgi:protein-disulfide isomerase
MKQKTLFVVAAVVMLLAFVIGTLVYTAQKKEQTTQRVDDHRSALVRMHSPTLGKADAPVVIVEFFDPACGTCSAFYPLVHDLLASQPDRIRLVLRYAPFHSGSDKVVAVLEAARKQGKFWPALEALLASQSSWVVNHTAQLDQVWPQLEGLGLNIDQLKTDMNAPAIADLIAQDLADAETLKVNMTPEFFVNGKPLPSFGAEQLRTLVADELNETQGR